MGFEDALEIRIAKLFKKGPEKLVSFRNKKDETQAQAARNMGIGKNSLLKYENDSNLFACMKLSTLLRICDYYDVSIIRFLSSIFPDEHTFEDKLKEISDVLELPLDTVKALYDCDEEDKDNLSQIIDLYFDIKYKKDRLVL